MGAGGVLTQRRQRTPRGKPAAPRVHELRLGSDPHREAGGLPGINGRYPWLAEECDRQVARREEAEALEASMLEEFEAEELARKDRQRSRSGVSANVIGDLSPGMAVRMSIRGRDRTGTITKVMRRPVEVSYRIKSGAERVARLYAIDVLPLAG